MDMIKCKDCGEYEEAYNHKTKYCVDCSLSCDECKKVRHYTKQHLFKTCNLCYDMVCNQCSNFKKWNGYCNKCN